MCVKTPRHIQCISLVGSRQVEAMWHRRDAVCYTAGCVCDTVRQTRKSSRPDLHVAVWKARTYMMVYACGMLSACATQNAWWSMSNVGCMRILVCQHKSGADMVGSMRHEVHMQVQGTYMACRKMCMQHAHIMQTCMGLGQACVT